MPRTPRAPLHLAARANRMDVVDAVLSKGCDPLVRDALGMSALEWALHGHHDGVAMALLCTLPPLDAIELIVPMGFVCQKHWG